jgi:hypothetical protein
MLPQHPDLMSDSDIEVWVTHLVTDQVEEGPLLDYKAQLNLKAAKSRLEAAKDIASFSNESGGVILYGVPQKKLAGCGIPGKPYGLDPIPGVEERLENVYADSIAPHLPEWRVRRIAVSAYPGKVVYLVWTPESWLGPHMVQAHGDFRYYRRCQCRAVEMAEHEVRDRYARTRIAVDAVNEYAGSPQVNYVWPYMYDLFRDSERQFCSHYFACPQWLVDDRVDFSAPKLREWLTAHRYEVEQWQWQPSPYGVRTRPPTRSAGDWVPFTEIHRNGAVSQWRASGVSDSSTPGQGTVTALRHVAELRRVLDFVRFCGQFYQVLGHAGPTYLRLTISPYVDGRTFRLPATDFASDWPELATHDWKLRIELAESATRLVAEPRAVLQFLANRLFQAFGLWEAPESVVDEIMGL